jgi:hypothetical protein
MSLRGSFLPNPDTKVFSSSPDSEVIGANFRLRARRKFPLQNLNNTIRLFCLLALVMMICFAPLGPFKLDILHNFRILHNFNFLYGPNLDNAFQKFLDFNAS